MNLSKSQSSRKRLPRSSFFGVGAAVVLAFVIGCAGSGTTGVSGAGGTGGFGANNNKALSGTNQDLAVGLLSAKATAAGVGVPFTFLNSVSPGGMFKAVRTAGSTPTPVPGLGLYMTSSVSGKILTMNFFTDSAGKSGAGKITVNATENIGSNYTYPVTFTATGSLTGGNVPLTISNTTPLKATFTSAKTNSFSGNMSLTNQSITLSFGLSLDSNGNLGANDFITAKYTYVYQGFINVPVEINLVDLTGNGTSTSLPTRIDGTAFVSLLNPLTNTKLQGTGSGVLDLAAGTFSLSNLDKDFSGLLSTYNITTDQLSVKVGTGFDQVISHASAHDINSLLTTQTGGTSSGGTSSGGTSSGGTSSGGTSSGLTGGTTGSTSGTYAAPVQIPGSGHLLVQGALGDGELVGYSLDSSNQSTALYWASPTSMPVALTGPNGETHGNAYGIATASGVTEIVGDYVTSLGQVQPCIWKGTSGSGSFTAVKGLPTFASGGALTAINANRTMRVGFKYDTSFTEHPVAFVNNQTFYDLPSDGRTTNLRAQAVDNNNDVVGSGQGNSTFPVAWTHITVDTTTNTITTTPTALQNNQGSSSNTQVLHMSDNGIIVGGDGFNAFYWQASDGYKQHLLSTANSFFGVSGFGVNHAGTEAAGNGFVSSPATTTDLIVWPTLTGNPVDVTTQLGSSIGNFQNLAGDFVLDNGSLICLAQVKGATSVTFVYVQKK